MYIDHHLTDMYIGHQLINSQIHLPNLWRLVAHNELFAHQSVFEHRAPKE